MAACSVALGTVKGAALPVYRQVPMVRGHAEALVPLIQDVMMEAGADFSAIDKIVTSVGPGAFTGLRIGLSTARALGLALGRPVYGLITLDILAEQFFARQALVAGQSLGVALETKRSDFYFGCYDEAGHSVGAAQALPAEEIVAQSAARDMILIGDGAARFMQTIPDDEHRFILSSGFDLPDPRVMVALARTEKGLRGPEPVYLRGADVSESKRKIRRLCDC